MDEGAGKIIEGPGRDRWPGSPNKVVGKEQEEVAGPTRLPQPDGAATRRDEKRRSVLRLKVISAVQLAVMCFTEEEIRSMIERAFENIRSRNDYS